MLEMKKAAAPLLERTDDASAHYTAVQHQQKVPSAVATPTQAFTTLMLRNLPNSYTRNMLSELLDNEGFSGHYDLVYVPVDFMKLAGLGYAFVNFTSNEAAEKARQAFQGFAAWKNTSQKVCEVSWSGPLQGLSAHIEHYRNSPVMHESVPECYKPGLFQGGLLRPFPHPTKEIKTPRMKRRGFHHK
jgi:RNA recognition motif-containing protein